MLLKDTVFPLLTVEEAIKVGAKLTLKLPQQQLYSRVKSQIQELGLDHVVGTRIGDGESKVYPVAKGEEFLLVMKSYMIQSL